MPEKTDINAVEELVTEDQPGTPPVKTEEEIQLEAQKAQLEAEIAGLEGTKASLLDDVVRTRKEKREVDDTPQVDIEAIKAEVEASILTKVSGNIVALKEELIKAKDSEIKAKQAVVKSITDRMASVSGSNGPSSPDSITENEVEISDKEKEIATELGLKNPRYLKDTEVRGM